MKVERRPSWTQNQGPRNSNQRRDERHILSELKQRYGDDFISQAEMNNEFKPGKMVGLIKSIFSDRFNFREYGQYLLEPPVLDILIQVAGDKYTNACLHMLGMDLIVNNEDYKNGVLFPGMNAPVPGDYLQSCLQRAWDEYNAWYLVYTAIIAIPATRDLTTVTSAMAQFRTMTCSDGRTPLIRVI